jgi:hypothetical protein
VDRGGGGGARALSHQNANARDLGKSFPFYQRVVGLDHNIRPFSPEPFDQSLGSLGRAIRNPDGTLYEGLVDFDAPFFSYRADGRNPIDLLQWELPGVFGRPYTVPNHLGIIRLAFEVDDIEAAYHKLRKAWHRVAGPPEEWDMRESAPARSSSSRTRTGSCSSSSSARRTGSSSTRSPRPEPPSRVLPARRVAPGSRFRGAGEGRSPPSARARMPDRIQSMPNALSEPRSAQRGSGSS